MAVVDTLVIHHSASANNLTADDIHKEHINKGWSGIGYHFVITPDGTVYTGRPVNAVGANVENQNSHIIGICLIGNSAQGVNALQSNTTGSNNSAQGVNAGHYIADGTTGRSTGNNGTYLGYNTKASANGTDNETVIGYNAIGNGSNTVTIGSSAVTATYINGQVIPAKLSTAPTGIEGGIYYNSTDKHFYGYNGTTWKQLDN